MGIKNRIEKTVKSFEENRGKKMHKKCVLSSKNLH